MMGWQPGPFPGAASPAIDAAIAVAAQSILDRTLQPFGDYANRNWNQLMGVFSKTTSNSFPEVSPAREPNPR
jgi:hypothetical protein